MSAQTQGDKFMLVAGNYISSGAPIHLPLELPWPEILHGGQNSWQRTATEGFNVFVLMQAAEDRGYKSPFWLSLRDGEAAGGTLKEGAKGVTIISWKWTQEQGEWKGDISPESVQAAEVSKMGEEDTLVVGMRPLVVFNAEAWGGINEWPIFYPRERPTKEEARERAARIEEVGAGCEIRYGGTHAYYNPSQNYISLPTMDAYGSPQRYYRELFEQIGHATASRHQIDLWGRPREGELAKDPSFKSLYAKMVAAVLAYETGIDVLE